MGATDQEILDYYADSGHRAKEVAAFFLIAGAALAFLVFVGFLVLALWVLAVSAALAFRRSSPARTGATS